MMGIWTPRAGAGSLTYTLTTAGSTWSAGYTSQNTSVDGRGYYTGDGGPHGSISGTTYKGLDIEGIFYYDEVQYLRILFDGTVPDADSFLYSMEIQGGPDGGSTWLRSAATKISMDTYEGFRWDDPAPLALNTTGNQTVILSWR
jgi:hypothetical protein